jgi:hypothetical protein
MAGNRRGVLSHPLSAVALWTIAAALPLVGFRALRQVLDEQKHSEPEGETKHDGDCE